MGSTFSRVSQREQEIKRIARTVHRPVFDTETRFSKSEMDRLFNQFWTMAYKPEENYSEVRLPHLWGTDLLKHTDTRNPLNERIITAFMAHKPRGQMLSSRLDFPSFINRMAVFLPSAPPNDKLDFLFRVYDMYDNKVLNVGDVKALLVELYGDEMTEDQRDILGREFLAEFSDEPEISRDLFIQMCEAETPIDDLVIRFS